MLRDRGGTRKDRGICLRESTWRHQAGNIPEMNPHLRVHPVYATKEFIPDYKREALTRVRLMSHNLRIEVGRWSRTPAEQRVCQCDGAQVQTEQHALIHCPLTARLRDDYPQLSYVNIQALFSEETYLEELCNYVYAMLETFN